MIHAIMGEDTKALTKDEEVQAYFKERFRKELARSEEASWDTPYRKLLNEVKGTEAYMQAMDMPHRARTARKIEKPQQGVLMFGKKGNDFVFKIGTLGGSPVMLSAEEALALFAAKQAEVPIDLSENFDIIYQEVKRSLFSNDIKDRNEKEILNAIAKVKMLRSEKLLPLDYLEDLMRCARSEALSGYEIRMINQLTHSEVKKLPHIITTDYLTRQIKKQMQVDDSEETIILSEELR